jgi:hypothetical protein
LKGIIEEFPMDELLRFVREGGRKGVLTVRRNGEVGEIFFAGGSIVSAVLGREVGNKALAEMARWSNGEFAIEYFAATDKRPNSVPY